MSNFTKPKAVLLCDPAREDLLFRKLDSVLPRLADFSRADSNQVKDLSDLEKIFLTHGESSTIFIDARWLATTLVEYSPEWSRKKIVLVVGEEGPDAKAPNVLEWQRFVSCLYLRRIANPDLPRVLQLAMCADRYPGIVILAERNSDIYFEKVHGLAEIGCKTDELVKLLEARHPTLHGQLFNLRQLSFAVLHQAFEACRGASKILPVVDFQVTASPERIVFAAKFSAPEGTLVQWLSGMAQRKNLIWHNAHLSADLLVFTELRKTKEIEFKALISRSGEFSANKEKSILVNSFENFLPDAAANEAQKAAKLQPLAAAAGAPGERPAVAPSAASEDSQSPALAVKLKADMLEDENNNLQGLVKKKTHLIAGLNQDVNRFQKELVQAKNAASKELHAAQLEAEKARGDCRKITEKLLRVQRKLTELEAANNISSASAGEGGAKGFEKEWKQAELARRLAEEKLADLKHKVALQDDLIPGLRKEVQTLTTEISELRAANFRLEKEASKKAREETAREELAAQAPAVSDAEQAEKLRELVKQSQDSKTREQNLEKEVKRLTLKLDSVEKNMKINQSTYEKQAAQAERLLEDTKRQKNDALKKLEEASGGGGAKSKNDDMGSAERVLKKKAEELSALLAKKTADAEKQTAELRKKILSQNARIEELTAQLIELQKKQKAA